MMAVAAESLFSTLDLKEERDEGTKVLGRNIENIAFEGVTLRYPNADATRSMTFPSRSRAVRLRPWSGFRVRARRRWST